MRWALLVLASILAACGPGDAPVKPSPPADEPPPTVLLGEPGSRQRGRQEVYGLVEGLRPGDAEGAPAALAKLDAYCEKNAGLPAEVEGHLLAIRILGDLQRYEEAGNRALVALELVWGQEKDQLQMDAVRWFRLASMTEKAVELLEDLGTRKLDERTADSQRMELAHAYFDLGRIDEGVALFEKEMARYGETSRAWRLRLELADYLTVNDRDERAGELCATIWPEHRDKSIGRSAGLLLAQIRARQGRRDEAKEILEGILPFAGDDIARAAHMLLDGIVKHGKPAPPVGGKLLDGTTLEPSELEGIPVVAVFWDPKIAISTHVMSRWSKLAEEGEGKRFRTVGFPVHSDKQAIRQAVEENGIAAPQIDTTPKTAETWRIRAVPWVHVIDAEGRWFSSGWPLNRLGGLPEPR